MNEAESLKAARDGEATTIEIEREKLVKVYEERAASERESHADELKRLEERQKAMFERAKAAAEEDSENKLRQQAEESEGVRRLRWSC